MDHTAWRELVYRLGSRLMIPARGKETGQGGGAVAAAVVEDDDRPRLDAVEDALDDLPCGRSLLPVERVDRPEDDAHARRLGGADHEVGVAPAGRAEGNRAGAEGLEDVSASPDLLPDPRAALAGEARRGRVAVGVAR